MTKKILALMLALCMLLAVSAAMAEKLTVTAWDANFNGNALQAAADDYKANVDPEFELEINIVSGSSDVENDITNAGSSGDYSLLSDIVLFQDRYIKNFVENYRMPGLIWKMPASTGTTSPPSSRAIPPSTASTTARRWTTAPALWPTVWICWSRPATRSKT